MTGFINESGSLQCIWADAFISNDRYSYLKQPIAYYSDEQTPSKLYGSAIHESTEFTTEVLLELLKEEKIFLPKMDYIQTIQKKHMSEWMRRELASWIFDVIEELRFECPETFGLAMNLVDRFLSINTIAPSALQLVGAACLLVAAKLKERYPPTLTALCHCAAESFSTDDLKLAEQAIMQTLDWRLNAVTPCVMLNYLLPHFGLSEATKIAIYHCAEMCADSIYMVYNFIKYPPSIIATASIFCAFKSFGIPERLFLETITSLKEFYSFEKIESTRLCCKEIEHLVHNLPKTPDSVSSSEFFQPDGVQQLSLA